ncbi:UDP-N-acetylmuramate dehydrogenase [Rhodovulum sp. DZ06]|uniref:UDP-N-acetylmuramate dehydrogenase n=1 Tax=Rhodovulum sp. DZ06 TaxID=3425126 RepID=UPI003D34894F
MTAALAPDALVARLPQVRGRITPMQSLAALTWLRVGGPAEAMFTPADAEDLSAFLAALPADIPVTPLGVGSNLIVRDGGVPGVCIRLSPRGFGALEPLEGRRIRVGAAQLDARAAQAAAQAGIAGLEFLRTIPGAIGGAVRMNAGCYGAYMADVLESATVIRRDGTVDTLGPDALGFAYRSCTLPPDSIVTEVILKGRPGDPGEIAAQMDAALKRREESQPTDRRSAGSTFRNPAGFSSTGRADDVHDLKAWKLIDDAGCRGLRRGGAMMSDMHCNFLLNAEDATAADLEGLGEEVRERVAAFSGIKLEWEIQRIGLPLEGDAPALQEAPEKG